MVKDVETQLKELILDEDFASLQNLANKEVNLMDILRVSNRELAHSNFLAWMFNPSESHNLGDFAIKEFIKIYFLGNQFQNLGNESGLSVFDFVQMDFSDIDIRREYKNIDLILLSNKNKFCIVIENKIYSTEKIGQLKKYREFVETEYVDFKHKIYIYLSLNEQEITEEEYDYYIQLNYVHIIKLIDKILSSQYLNLSNQTRFVFDQYLQTIKSMLNKNDEIKQVAEMLYKKYKSAFDLVYKYSGPANFNEIANIIQDLIKNEKTIRPFYSNNTYVRFQPNFLYENLESLINSGLVSESDDLTNNWEYLFEFNVRNHQVMFDFKIGEGDQLIREKLYGIYSKYPEIFNKVIRASGRLSGKWHLAFQRQILSKSEIEKYFTDENYDIRGVLSRRFEDLINNDLPKIIKCINAEL